jgi:hypothetical protein
MGQMDWLSMSHDRDRWAVLVHAVMNLRVLHNAGNFLNSGRPVSFSGRSLLYAVSVKADRNIRLVACGFRKKICET